jgi:hypothetical protein
MWRNNVKVIAVMMMMMMMMIDIAPCDTIIQN